MLNISFKREHCSHFKKKTQNSSVESHSLSRDQADLPQSTSSPPTGPPFPGGGASGVPSLGARAGRGRGPAPRLREGLRGQRADGCLAASAAEHCAQGPAGRLSCIRRETPPSAKCYCSYSNCLPPTAKATVRCTVYNGATC